MWDTVNLVLIGMLEALAATLVAVVALGFACAGAQTGWRRQAVWTAPRR